MAVAKNISHIFLSGIEKPKNQSKKINPTEKRHNIPVKSMPLNFSKGQQVLSNIRNILKAVTITDSVEIRTGVRPPAEKMAELTW